MECILFLTHNFLPEFIRTLERIDQDPNVESYRVFVFVDSTATYDESIHSRFRHIVIQKVQRGQTSYDEKGHAMYIHYFRNHPEFLASFSNIWIFENDVYYPKSMLEFVKKYSSYSYDLLVPEYGLRAETWYWLKSLWNFQNVQTIGVSAFCMRLSRNMCEHLVTHIDKIYWGYLEVILPHICLNYGFTIQTFLPETCGILTTDQTNPFLQSICMDILSGTKKYLEEKLYHPIKL